MNTFPTYAPSSWKFHMPIPIEIPSGRDRADHEKARILISRTFFFVLHCNEEKKKLN